MSKDVTLAEYRDENGTRHRVCGRWDARTATWEITDITRSSRVTIDRLRGAADDAPQAAAVAQDYAEQMKQYVTGQRPTHPMPSLAEVIADPDNARAEVPRPARARHELVAA